MDALKKAAFVSTIALALITIITVVFKVTTKNDLAEFKTEFKNDLVQLELRLTSVMRETTGSIEKEVSSIKETSRVNQQNHVEHLAYHNQAGINNRQSP